MASSPTIPRSSLALRRIALLEGLSDERLDLLAQHCSWHSVDAGKPLLMRAEQQGDVFLLVSGRVRVTTYSANGRQVTFRDSEAGEHFGWLARFFSTDCPASSALTQQRLGWHPVESTLLADLDQDHYFTREE